MASNSSGRFALLLTAGCRAALTGTRIPKTPIRRRSGRLSTPTRPSPSSKRPDYANREGNAHGQGTDNLGPVRIIRQSR
jgi:hypothetical protein